MVLLNLVVCNDFLSRIDSLFEVAYLCEKNADVYMENSVLGSVRSKDMIDESSAIVETHEIEDRVETVSVDTLIRMIELLVATNQIPSVKQVKETGVEYPLVTYRVKTPSEMVDSFFDANKISEKPLRFNKDDFRAIMLCKQVCVWGECYRQHK